MTTLTGFPATAHSRDLQKLAEAPPATGGNLVEKAAMSNQFHIFTTAVKAAGLTETLSFQGPYTVFAPTDKAFAALPPGILERLLKPENQDLLLQVLGQHVVHGEITTSQIKPGRIETISGRSVAVQVDGTGEVTVNKAEIIQSNIQASNGVIHAIDRVILPPQLLAQMQTASSKALSHAHE